MRTYQIKSILVTLCLCSINTWASASELNSELNQIQKQWAYCQYEEKNSNAKEACFEQVLSMNEQALQTVPYDLELMVWHAINKASLAGAQGGLGALSLVKESKATLEKVISIEPSTLAGSAYTTLGSLYYQVPGWPIGFGSDKKAEAMLKKALEINPYGIDPNYFYADFLAKNGRKKEAKVYLLRAQKAAPRTDRALADQGRQQEINAILATLE